MVADADDRALAVDVQEPRRLGRGTGPLELEQGLVDATAMDIAAQHITPAIEFGSAPGVSQGMMPGMMPGPMVPPQGFSPSGPPPQSPAQNSALTPPSTMPGQRRAPLG